VTGVVDAKGRLAKTDVFMHLDDAVRIADKRLAGGNLGGRVNAVLFEATSRRTLYEALGRACGLFPEAVVSGGPPWRLPVKVLGLNAQAVVVLMVAIAVFAAAMLSWSGAFSVTKRRSELDALLADGRSNGRIIGLVLAASLFQAGVGAAGGLLASFVVLQVMSDAAISSHGSALSLSPLAVALVIVVTLLVGCISGLVSGITAVSKKPVGPPGTE